MAKNQVTEEQLSQGLKGMGGFGSLAQRPRRDHPFRSSANEPVKVIDVAPRIAPVLEEDKFTGSREEREEKVISMKARRAPDKAELQEPEAPQPAATRQAGKKKQPRAQAARKADVFSERITLQLSPKMRDKADALAKDLQRLRTSKEERITANTVMRVAVKLVLDKFKPGVGESVANTEEELFELVRKQLCGG